MAAGWAVGSALVLALSVGALLLDPGFGALSGPAMTLVVLLHVAVYAAWAMALVRATHGSRAALLTLLGHVLAWGLVAGALDVSRCHDCLTGARVGPPLYGLVLAAASLGGVVALVREVRSRRGPLQAGAALLQLLPTALLAGLLAIV